MRIVYNSTDLSPLSYHIMTAARVGKDTKPTAGSSVYEAIRKRILEGYYAPLEYVRESTVAIELGVSRTPVREALRELVSEGWLEAIPHHGARVVEWTERDAKEVFDIRLLLEPMATARAAQHITQDKLALLEELAQRMEGMVDLVSADQNARNDIAALNFDFHRILIEASESQRLIQLLANLVPNSVIRRNFNQYEINHLRRSMQHHREILAAVRARNPEWAKAVMENHLLAARGLHIQFAKPE